MTEKNTCNCVYVSQEECRQRMDMVHEEVSSMSAEFIVLTAEVKIFKKIGWVILTGVLSLNIIGIVSIVLNV